MTSMEITQEMRAKLMRAKDQEEVRAILGSETTEEEIQQVWQEIQHHCPAEGLEAVEDDELEAVSGGYERDYGKNGCSATVEAKSFCWKDDACIRLQVEYVNRDPCPKGTSASRNHVWKAVGWEGRNRLWECKQCGETASTYEEYKTY